MGTFFVYVAFFSCLFSSAFYFLTSRGKVKFKAGKIVFSCLCCYDNFVRCLSALSDYYASVSVYLCMELQFNRSADQPSYIYFLCGTGRELSSVGVFNVSAWNISAGISYKRDREIRKVLRSAQYIMTIMSRL